jgi:superfamily II DNA/RNA helicase
MKFQDLIDNEQILSALTELGFETPTPIQEKAIPAILAGGDLQAAAQTGTGKTAAFLIPILTRLGRPVGDGSNSKHGPRALVLVPTRELAMQLATETAKLSRHMKLTTVCVYGGVPYPIENRKLAKRYDILIATPGRLIDQLEQGRIHLDQVQVMVLDEADRMLDMGFIGPVEEIASLVPDTRQMLLFSATMGKGIQKLASKLLRKPAVIESDFMEERTELIEQHLQRAESLEEKQRYLEEILVRPELAQAIVFSATKMQAERIADLLRERGFKAAALHGDMHQRQRTRTIHQLREGKIQILVATDVAARGIDVLTISHVINFDCPKSLEDYIHRIGRTGRAGSRGCAVSFVSGRDRQIQREIEQFSGLKLAPDPNARPAAARHRFAKSKRFEGPKKFFGPKRHGGPKRQGTGTGPFAGKRRRPHSD